MAYQYREIPCGATAYPLQPQMTTLAPSGPLPTPYALEPQWHRYQVLSPSGADVFISHDGRNDGARIMSAPGALPAEVFPLSAKSCWLRSAAGVTATVGVGFYTK